MMNKGNTKKLKFKYFLTKDGDYLISDNLHSEYIFIRNVFTSPELFRYDLDIENIYNKIVSDIKIEDIYEKYLYI